MTGATVALVATAILSPALADKAVGVATFAGWQVFEATDQMTDKKWVGASTSAPGIRMQIDCAPYAPKKLHVGFDLEEYIGGDFHDFHYRAGTRPAHTVVASTNDRHLSPLCEGQCTGKAGGPDPSELLLSEIKQTDILLLRFEVWQHKQIDLTLPVGGAADAIADVLQRCGALAKLK